MPSVVVAVVMCRQNVSNQYYQTGLAIAREGISPLVLFVFCITLVTLSMMKAW